MNKSNVSRYIVTAVVGAAIGFGLSSLIPGREEIKEVTKYQDRVRVVKQIVERPDGTRETTETTERDTTLDQSKQVSKKVPDWSVGVGASLPKGPSPIYTLQVQRRILGSIYAGAYVRTDSELGVLVSFQF